MKHRNSHTEQPSSAAEMIRRFREAKPTSQAERQQNLKKGKLREMWWVDNKDSDMSASISGRDIGVSHKVPLNTGFSEDTTPAPRPSPLKPRPYPPPKPFTQKPEPSYIPPHSAIDDEIFSELAHMSMDKSIQRELKRGHELLTSLDHPRHSLEKSLERRHRRQQENDDIPVYRFREGPSHVAPHQSLESLGFSLKGLLFPELQLDGREESPQEESAPSGQVADIQTNLEELLKSLAVDKELRTEDGHLATIPQVFNKLNTDMMTFISRYTEKYAEEEAAAAERKAHDDLMREEGRREERERLLKEMQFERRISEDDLLLDDDDEEEIWGYPEGKDDDTAKKRMIASFTESATEMRLDESVRQLRRNHGRFHHAIHSTTTQKPQTAVKDSPINVSSSLNFEPNHETIAKATESIVSTMQVCLNMLHLRLPETVDDTPPPPKPALPHGVAELDDIVPSGSPPLPSTSQEAETEVVQRVPVSREALAEIDAILGTSADDMSFPTQKPKPPKYSDMLLAQRQANMYTNALNIARHDQPFYPYAPPAYNPNIIPSAPPEEQRVTFHRDENVRPQVNIRKRNPIIVELKPPNKETRSVSLPTNVAIPSSESTIHEREKFLENMRKMRTGYTQRHTLQV